MFCGFWALKIAPGHTYTQTVDASFRVSNAALGLNTANEDSRTSVVVTVDGKSFVLCSLTPGKIEQQPLDIWLSEGEEITFESQGDNEIHLTGNFINEEEEEDEESADEDDDGDMLGLEYFSPEELQEMVKEGLVDPSKLLDLESEGSDDPDYDSDDAEADGLIREITSDEERELADEAMSSEEEEPKPEPVKEVKIKKQAQKKRKAEAAAAAATAAEEEEAANRKKVKKAETESKKKEEVKKEKAATKTLAGGVVAEIQKEGTGAVVKKGARVGMYYIGKLTNGKVFDKNVKGKPFWFRLGAGEVIKGWDVGIVGMKKGGERRLTIPAAMAYGKRGAPPDIPPNATLVFDIRLVEF
ncbi:hypothetical protein BX070DRAFT_230737, partial [Coemansia spiralis]